MMKKKYEPLFEPYMLNNGVEIKNRLTVAPLTIYDSGDNGELTSTAREFWRDRFNGFGMFIMPFTNVAPNGVGFESPDAFDRSNLETLKEYVQISHSQGAKIIMQIGHAGYKANRSMTRGYNVVSVSDVNRKKTRVMTTLEVQTLVKKFANAAKLGIEAGMDGVEIQGSNGWLSEQFFSGNTNNRTDVWGGSLDQRMKFSLDIIDAIDKVRKQYKRPDFIIGYRFSPERPGKGFTMADSLKLVDKLVEKPLQYLHVSLLGFYSHARRGADTSLTRMKIFHDRINGKLPLIGVGSLYTADQILDAYNTNWAEFIALGRTVMLNPNLISLIKENRENEIQTQFDWSKKNFYRYTPAMLQAKSEGMDLARRTPHRIKH